MKKIYGILLICILCSLKLNVYAANENNYTLLKQMIPKSMSITEGDFDKNNLELDEEGITFTVNLAMNNLKQWRVSKIYIEWRFDDIDWDDVSNKKHTYGLSTTQYFENYTDGKYSLDLLVDKYTTLGEYYPEYIAITYVDKNNSKIKQVLYGEHDKWDDFFCWYFEEGDDEESENSIDYASEGTDYNNELDFKIVKTIVNDNKAPVIKNISVDNERVFNKDNPPKIYVTVYENGSGIKSITMSAEAKYDDLNERFIYESSKDKQFLGTHTYEVAIEQDLLKWLDDGCYKFYEIGVMDYALNYKGKYRNLSNDLKFYYCNNHKIQNVTRKATKTKNGYKQKQCLSCGKVDEGSKVIIPRIKSVKLSKDSYVYDGKIKKPYITVKDSNGKKLKKNTDYTLSYSKGRKNVGSYKVKVTFKGKYKGTITKTFKIKPRATGIHKISRSRRAITVKWYKRNKQISGYQICYGRSTNKEKCKKITVKSYKTTSKKITGLTKNKKYYVWVRTYKTVNGTKYYSSWSKRKSVTVR